MRNQRTATMSVSPTHATFLALARRSLGGSGEGTRRAASAARAAALRELLTTLDRVRLLEAPPIIDTPVEKPPSPSNGLLLALDASALIGAGAEPWA